MRNYLYRLNRNVTALKHPWLDRDYLKGDTVYPFRGCTYGCIGHDGVAVSDSATDGPFFELPMDALTEVEL